MYVCVFFRFQGDKEKYRISRVFLLYMLLVQSFIFGHNLPQYVICAIFLQQNHQMDQHKWDDRTKYNHPKVKRIKKNQMRACKKSFSHNLLLFFKKKSVSAKWFSFQFRKIHSSYEHKCFIWSDHLSRINLIFMLFATGCLLMNYMAKHC